MEPIHIEIDATAQEAASGDEKASFINSVASQVAKKTTVPGTLSGDLMLGCIVFYHTHGRWPKNIDELEKRFLEAGESTESFRHIEMIEFRHLPNGDLEITYEAKGPITATMNLQKPSIEGSHQDGGAAPK